MEKLFTTLLNVGVGTTVVTVVLTVAATVAGLIALVTQVAAGAAILFSGAALVTASIAALLTLLVEVTHRADVDLEPL